MLDGTVLRLYNPIRSFAEPGGEKAADGIAGCLQHFG